MRVQKFLVGGLHSRSDECYSFGVLLYETYIILKWPHRVVWYLNEIISITIFINGAVRSAVLLNQICLLLNLSFPSLFPFSPTNPSTSFLFYLLCFSFICVIFTSFSNESSPHLSFSWIWHHNFFLPPRRATVAVGIKQFGAYNVQHTNCKASASTALCRLPGLSTSLHRNLHSQPARDYLFQWGIPMCLFQCKSYTFFSTSFTVWVC